MAITSRFTTCLWFDSQAEEAANYYVSIFKNSKVEKVQYYSSEGFEYHKRPEGSIMTVYFTLDGASFLGLNGGPHFKFNEAVSIIVNCSNQQEVDYYWEKLSAGGDPKAQQCGWLKDKYGLSWQIVPTEMDSYFDNPESEGNRRASRAMYEMKKLDINQLRSAYEGK